MIGSIGITQRCTKRNHYALENEHGKTVGTVEQSLQCGSLRMISTDIDRYRCKGRSAMSTENIGHNVWHSPYKVTQESTGQIVATWNEGSGSLALADGEVLRYQLRGRRPASAEFALIARNDTTVAKMHWVEPVNRWSFIRPFPLGEALISSQVRPIDDMVFITALAFHLFACAMNPFAGRAALPDTGTY